MKRRAISRCNRVPRPVRTARKMKLPVLKLPRVIDREIVQASKLFKVRPEKVLGLIVHFRLMDLYEGKMTSLRDVMEKLGIPIPKNT